MAESESELERVLVQTYKRGNVVVVAWLSSPLIVQDPTTLLHWYDLVSSTSDDRGLRYQRDALPTFLCLSFYLYLLTPSYFVSRLVKYSLCDSILWVGRLNNENLKRDTFSRKDSCANR